MFGSLLNSCSIWLSTLLNLKAIGLVAHQAHVCLDSARGCPKDVKSGSLPDICLIEISTQLNQRALCLTAYQTHIRLYSTRGWHKNLRPGNSPYPYPFGLDLSFNLRMLVRQLIRSMPTWVLHVTNPNLLGLVVCKTYIPLGFTHCQTKVCWACEETHFIQASANPRDVRYKSKPYLFLNGLPPYYQTF